MQYINYIIFFMTVRIVIISLDFKAIIKNIKYKRWAVVILKFNKVFYIKIGKLKFW